jgi:light-regulated signal transduction histidine kinase (bacteriophytochrome)
MDRTISLVRNGQVDLAMLGEANGSGRMIMDRIRKVSDGLIEQLKLQRQSLAQQSAAASESTQTINSVSGLITLPLIFLLFALSWTSVHAFFRNKEHKSEAQVELEKAVQMRTRELKTAKDELEAFSYSVSHDLRGPLRAVISYASMLEEDYADKIGEEGQEFLERIKASGRRMSELIDTLLALSRLSRAEISIETIDASAMAEEVLRDLAKNEPDATTTYSVEPDIHVKADRKMLMTLLENLLRNAWKFSARSEDPHIEVSYSSEKHAMVVRDNGVGFNEEYASKLFQPFQRLHSEREFEGLGIGLAIVDRIVSRHGGRIWAESKEGEGATFFVDMEPSGRSTRSSESAPSVR